MRLECLWCDRPKVIEADVSREDHVKAMFSTVIECWGSVNILVNNAVCNGMP
jgi:NAD(P)-dependent dehydrogenase (short-subunit alcohol dehydrogenase family)